MLVVNLFFLSFIDCVVRVNRVVAQNVDDKLTEDYKVIEILSFILDKLYCPLHYHKSPMLEQEEICASNKQLMKKYLGYSLQIKDSAIPNGGLGVFLDTGAAQKGSIVGIYPGTVYQPGDPILLQSFRNPFIFRCLDGTLIDGSNKGISKFIFKSCVNRDSNYMFLAADSSWLTQNLLCPLNSGQFVNNCTKEDGSNVVYQELDLKYSDSPSWSLIPNVNYSSSGKKTVRLVTLVAKRDIREGEELFSDYFTFVT